MKHEEPQFISRSARAGRPDVPRMGQVPLAGRQALLIGALIFGLLMMALQLWLLSVALELYLGGEGNEIWGLAIGSGIVFAGGLFVVWLLARPPAFER